MYNGRMAPQTSKNDGREQVATRVHGQAARVLALVAAAEGKSMTDLLRPVVEAHAEALADEPEIAAILEQADKWIERSTGVASIGRPSRRKQRNRGASAGKD